jgi:hypothetical protein
MDGFLKKVWLTSHTADLSTITLKSNYPDNEDCKRIRADNMLFPKEPTPEYPLRHTMVIGLLSREDLISMRDAIDIHIGR